MKKFISIVLLMIFMSINVFAESIDDAYINLIFDKFQTYDEETKQENIEVLKVFMSSNTGLDVLYHQVVTTMADTMASYNITEGDLKRNFDALKTWSASDRLAMVEAGGAGDLATVRAINDKYKVTAPPVVVVPDPVEEPEVVLTFAETLESKGFLWQPLEIQPELEFKTFKDTQGHWSKEYVNFLVQRGIIAGKSETSFAPKDNIKKSEIITLIVKLVVKDAEKLPDTSETFSDLQTGAWYDLYMKQAYVLGLIQKDINGNLNPNEYSTREEVVEILINTMEALGIELDEALTAEPTEFIDFDDVTESRKEAMAIAINLDFINGKGGGVIAPLDEISRAEIAVVIKKLYLYILGQL